MTKTVYKYPVIVGKVTPVELPAGAQFCHFGQDPGSLRATSPTFAVWYQVNPETEEKTEHNFCIALTGDKVPAAYVYRRTTIIDSGMQGFVLHLFEISGAH